MIKILPWLVSLVATSFGFDLGGDWGGFIPDDSRIQLPSLYFSNEGTIPIDFGSDEGIGFSISKRSSKSSSSSRSSAITSSRPSSLSASNKPDVEDYFYCDRYGPFPLRNISNFDATFVYELNHIDSQQIIERIRLFKNGSVVSASSKGVYSYTKGERKSVTFTINLRDHFSTSGLEIRFEIINTNYQVLKGHAVTIYPPSFSNIQASVLKSAPYQSQTIAFDGDGKEMRAFKERFDFTGIGDYIDNDYYYRLDIKRNKFLYPNDIILSYKAIKLRFNDSEYLFPNFTHQANGDIIIPLLLTRDGEKINFRFKNKFYVNKRTLDISDTYLTNYISTSDFYLPINGLKKFNGTTLYIDIEEIGADKISTTIPLRYELNRAIVGTCSDGGYCVSGGNS